MNNPYTIVHVSELCMLVWVHCVYAGAILVFNTNRMVGHFVSPTEGDGENVP
jgi:hypothetical protein